MLPFSRDKAPGDGTMPNSETGVNGAGTMPNSETGKTQTVYTTRVVGRHMPVTHPGSREAYACYTPGYGREAYTSVTHPGM